MNAELQALKERRSVRKYKADMVPQELIDQVIDAGLYAASGHGTQEVIIVAVTNKEVRDKLAQMNREILGTSIDSFMAHLWFLLFWDLKAISLLHMTAAW